MSVITSGKKYKYEVKADGGPHYEPNPKFNPSLSESEDNLRYITYLPGDVVLSSRQLDRVFPNKFTLIEVVEPTLEESNDACTTSKKDSEEDVTNEFNPLAKEAKVYIFRDTSSGLYFVYSQDDLIDPLEGSREGFIRKSEVREFIKGIHVEDRHAKN